MGELEGAVSTAVSKTAEDEEVRLDREAWKLPGERVPNDRSLQEADHTTRQNRV